MLWPAIVQVKRRRSASMIYAGFGLLTLAFIAERAMRQSVAAQLALRGVLVLFLLGAGLVLYATGKQLTSYGNPERPQQ